MTTIETAPTLAETEALLADFIAFNEAEATTAKRSAERAFLTEWYANSPSGIAIDHHLAGRTVTLIR